MKIDHEILLKNYLKDNKVKNVLFYDTIDNKRIDLRIWLEPSIGSLCISGDEGEIYTFDELELIDNKILENEN